MELINFINFFFLNVAVHISAYDMLLVAAFFSSTDVTEKSGLILICYTYKCNARHCNLHRVVIFLINQGRLNHALLLGRCEIIRLIVSKSIN